MWHIRFEKDIPNYYNYCLACRAKQELSFFFICLFTADLRRSKFVEKNSACLVAFAAGLALSICGHQTC